MTKQPLNIKDKPHVGVGVIIKQNHKIILGRRLNQPMQGSWQLPGGWIGLGESPEQAVLRQLSRFRNLRFGKSHFVTYTNNVFDLELHSLSLYFMVDCLNDGQQKFITDQLNSEWFWSDWNELPQPLFLPLQLLVDSTFNPFH